MTLEDLYATIRTLERLKPLYTNEGDQAALDRAATVCRVEAEYLEKQVPVDLGIHVTETMSGRDKLG